MADEDIPRTAIEALDNYASGEEESDDSIDEDGTEGGRGRARGRAGGSPWLAVRHRRLRLLAAAAGHLLGAACVGSNIH